MLTPVSWRVTEFHSLVSRQTCAGPGARGNPCYSLGAFCDDELCGIAASKPESVIIPPAPRPLGGGKLRRAEVSANGAGKLLGAIEDLARSSGYARTYCRTSTTTGSFDRGGWQLVERFTCEGDDVSIVGRKR